MLVQWTEAAPTTGGSTVPLRYWQLDLERPDGGLMIMVGLAPAVDFASSGVASTMASLRLLT